MSKVESTTLLEKNFLYDFIDRDLPPSPMNRRMYGGGIWGGTSLYYATGDFYFMSIDLAAFVGQLKKAV